MLVTYLEIICRFIVEHIVEMGSLGDFLFGTFGDVTEMLGVIDSLSESKEVVSASCNNEVSARESSSCCLNSLSFGLLFRFIFWLLHEEDAIMIISSSSSVTPLPPPEVLADLVLP